MPGCSTSCHSKFYTTSVLQDKICAQLRYQADCHTLQSIYQATNCSTFVITPSEPAILLKSARFGVFHLSLDKQMNRHRPPYFSHPQHPNISMAQFHQKKKRFCNQQFAYYADRICTYALQNNHANTNLQEPTWLRHRLYPLSRDQL